MDYFEITASLAWGGYFIVMVILFTDFTIMYSSKNFPISFTPFLKGVPTAFYPSGFSIMP